MAGEFNGLSATNLKVAGKPVGVFGAVHDYMTGTFGWIAVLAALKQQILEPAKGSCKIDVSLCQSAEYYMKFPCPKGVQAQSAGGYLAASMETHPDLVEPKPSIYGTVFSLKPVLSYTT